MALQHLRSSTANKRPLPAGMGDGQLAINTNLASPGIFFKDSNGDLVKAGPVHVGSTAPNVSPAAGGQTGNTTGELWLDTSLTPNELKTWSGSAWVSATGQEIPVSKLIDGAARQLLQTDAAGTGVEWTSNVDVPGTLDVTGATTLDSTLTVPLGSAAAPTLRFTGDTNTGIYSPGADQVAISTNGTGRLFVDSSGNVGAGTSSISAKLHVSNGDSSVTPTANADEIFVESSGNAGITLGSPNTGNCRISFGDPEDAQAGLIFYDHATNHLRFDTAATERLRITSTGLVGIGTSSPDTLLHLSGLNGGSSTTNRLRITDTDTAVIPDQVCGGIEFETSDLSNPGVNCQIDAIYTDHAGAGELQFRTGLAGSLIDALRIDSSGRVGIGVTSPGSFASDANNLVVGTGSGSQGLTVYSGNANRGIINFADGTSGIETYVGQISYRHDDNALTFGTGGGERFRCDNSGRLLVGTSSGSANTRIGQTFAVVSTQPDFGGASITSYSGTNGSYGPAIDIQRSRGTSDGSFTAVANNDRIGAFVFRGSDGTQFVDAALIKCDIDGTPGANDMPGRLVFSSNPGAPATGPAEAMRINSAQELLIGYTSDNGAYKLQVNSQIFATSATIATSDGRYKENVAALDGCVDLVKALRPVSFDWKAQEPITRVDEHGETVVVREAHNFPDGKQVGFIAQEVEEVLADKPWLGSVIKQNVRPAVTDADGNELAPEEEFLGIAEGNLVALLTSALKDAIGRIESLEAEVAALKA